MPVSDMWALFKYYTTLANGTGKHKAYSGPNIASLILGHCQDTGKQRAPDSGLGH